MDHPDPDESRSPRAPTSSLRECVPSPQVVSLWTPPALAGQLESQGATPLVVPDSEEDLGQMVEVEREEFRQQVGGQGQGLGYWK